MMVKSRPKLFLRALHTLILSSTILICLVSATAQINQNVPSIYLGIWLNGSEGNWYSLQITRRVIQITGRERDKVCRVDNAQPYKHGSLLGFGGAPAVAVTCSVTPEFRRRAVILARGLGIQARTDARRIIHLKLVEDGRFIEVFEELRGAPPADREMFMGDYWRR